MTEPRTLTDAQVKMLARVFCTPTPVRFLLEDAGLGRELHPDWSGPALEYWRKVNDLLADGAVPAGARHILEGALALYPGNEVFATGTGRDADADAASDSDPSSPGGSSSASGSSSAWRPPKGVPVMVSVLVIDAAGFSQRRARVQTQWREGIYAVTEQALARAGVPRDRVRLEDRGDGFLGLVSIDVPLATIVADVMQELAIALAEYNSVRNDTGRIRLRAAVHRGDVIFDAFSFTSDAPVVATRLGEAPAAKKLLVECPEVNLVLVVSDEVHKATVLEQERGLLPEQFEPIEVMVKSYSGGGWMRSFGGPAAPVGTAAKSSAAPADPEATARGHGPARLASAASTARRAPATGAEAADPLEADEYDFFVSCAQDDVGWGRWIQWNLEHVGFRVFLEAQAVAGSRSVHSIHEGIRLAKRTIAVMSEQYLRLPRVQAEWQAAFDADPVGAIHKLIPVRVEPCRPEGLLRGIVYIDLVGLSKEDAVHELVDEVRASMAGRRRRPERPPAFPGRP